MLKQIRQVSCKNVQGPAPHFQTLAAGLVAAVLFWGGNAVASEVYWKGSALAGPPTPACTATPGAASKFNSLGYDKALESSFRPGQLLLNFRTWLLFGHGSNLAGYNLTQFGAGAAPANGGYQSFFFFEPGWSQIYNGGYINYKVHPANYDHTTKFIAVSIRIKGVAGIDGCNVSFQGRYIRNED